MSRPLAYRSHSGLRAELMDRRLDGTLFIDPMWKQGGWPAMHRGIEDLGDGIAAQRVVYEQLLRDRGDRVLCGRDEHLAVAPRCDCVSGREWSLSTFDAEWCKVLGRTDGYGAVEAVQRARPHALGLEAI